MGPPVHVGQKVKAVRSRGTRRSISKHITEDVTAEGHAGAAQQALQCDDFKKAIHHFRRAADLAPAKSEYLDCLGAVLAETGQQDEAVKVLQKAVSLQPDRGFAKYMYLGQLLEADQANAAMWKGIDVLQSAIDSKDYEDGDESELGAQLCSALCCLAEAKLGDESAEVAGVGEECEGLLLRAAEADPNSPEPMQVLASLRVEQGRPEEALHCLRRSMATWCPHLLQQPEDGPEDIAEGDGSEAAAAEMEEAEAAGRVGGEEAAGAEQAAGVGDGTSDGTGGSSGQEEAEMPEGADGDAGSESEEGEEEDDADDDLPSFEFRFETAKLLIELDDSTHAAVEVLEELLAEDDSVPDAWYLLGLALHAGGEFEEALGAAAEAERLLARRRADEDPPGGPREAGALLLDLAELKAAVEESMANIAEA